MHKVFISLFALILLASAAYGQPSHYRQITPVGSAVSDAIRCNPRSGGYDVSPTFNEMYREQCLNELKDTGFERTGMRLIRWNAAGDCHLRTAVKVFRSDSDKRVRVVVNKIYGGCRAGGWRAGWIVLEAPPKGYLVSVEEVSIDRIHNTDVSDKFFFPSSPPVVTIDNVDVTETDLANCLPLTGQSRWVISSKEVLDNALVGKANEAECRERLALMKIDFNERTLIGVSFATGYCTTPPSLKMSVIKETSTNKRNNTYVVQARYDGPKASCHAFITYPVWMLITKIAEGYGLEVDARRNSIADAPRNVERKIEWLEEAD